MCDWSAVATMHPLLVASIHAVKVEPLGQCVTSTRCTFLGKAPRSSLNVGAAASWKFDHARWSIQ
jgi:hypothetical protein